MMQEVIATYHRLRSHNLINVTEAGDGADMDVEEAPLTTHDAANNLTRIIKVIEMVYYAKRVVLSTIQASMASHQIYCSDVTLSEDVDRRLGSWSLRFRWIDGNKINEYQSLILYLLDCAFEKKLRKQEGSNDKEGGLFEPVHVDGHNTHAFRYLCTIEEFVHRQTEKEMQFQQWSNLTHGTSTVKGVVEHLRSCYDYQLPLLRKDRHVFSFRNGIFFAGEDRFQAYTSEEPVGDSVVSAKYFDVHFEPYSEIHDWRDIETPTLDSILDYQDLPESVKRWIYVFLGRMLYDVNEKDGWQICLFIKGYAGTGKCFRLGTRVLLARGSALAVEDVSVGDTLMGDDGTPRTVVSLARGTEPLFEIRDLEGTLIAAVTGLHILCLIDHHGKGAVREMSVLEYLSLPSTSRQALRMYRPAQPLVFRNEREPRCDPYAVGAWMAGDRSVDSPAFQEALRRYGLTEGSTHVPEDLLLGTPQTRAAVLRGLRDHGLSNTFIERSLGIGGGPYEFTISPRPIAEPYVGFQVTGNQRFLLEDFSVTHNSTILQHVVGNFYDKVDTATMSNNAEERFGLSALYRAYVVIAPECRRDFKIEQAEMQSIISGEMVQINKKHQTAFSVVWKAPVIMAGNETPQMNDTSNSVGRRWAIVDFVKPVHGGGDMRLGDKLRDEIPDILVKCNRAYLEAAEEHGDKNIWTVLPEYFKKTSSEVAQSINMLEAFLASDRVEFGPEKYVPFDSFKEKLYQYGSEHNFRRVTFQADYFRGPFTQRAIAIQERISRNWHGRQYNNKTFLIGIDIVDASDQHF